MTYISRRRFAVAGLAPALSYASVFGLSSAIAQTEPVPTKSLDEWVAEWKEQRQRNKELSGPLDLRRFSDPMYILLNPISWKAGIGQSGGGKPLKVPAYFVTDFASIPRIFWSIFPTDGKYAYAAVLHDYAYWVQDRPKTEADTMFRLAMSDLKITDRQASVLYKAVDLLGSSSWRINAKKKEAGEKRILALLPEDPTVSWDEWRRRSDVFAN